MNKPYNIFLSPIECPVCKTKYEVFFCKESDSSKQESAKVRIAGGYIYCPKCTFLITDTDISEKPTSMAYN